MALKSKPEYLDSLRRMNKCIFSFGEEIEDYVNHPLIRPSTNAVAMTYELSHSPGYLGLLVPLPLDKDFDHPDVGPLLKKYLVGSGEYPVENRQRLLRLIENLTMGTGAVAYLTESLHGAGSPMAQRIMLRRLANFDEKEKIVKTIAGITPSEGDVL